MRVLSHSDGHAAPCAVNARMRAGRSHLGPHSPAHIGSQRIRPAIQGLACEVCCSAEDGLAQGELPVWPGQERAGTTAERALFCSMRIADRGIKPPQRVGIEPIIFVCMTTSEKYQRDGEAGSFGAGRPA